jgi:ribosome-associated protein
VIDVGNLLVVTDYFVVCTGETDRQVAAIADEIERQLKDAGLSAIGREGLEESKWILLDFADLVAHIFQPAERDFYRLERLWDDAPRIELPPEVENASYLSQPASQNGDEAPHSGSGD